MSLATRCPACSTVFRVVQDQLRVSEGWVRCGRCSEVFNAVDHMVDLPRPTAVTAAADSPPAPAWPAASSAPAPGAVIAASPAAWAAAPPGLSPLVPSAEADVLIESDRTHDPREPAWGSPEPAPMGDVARDVFDERDESTRVFPAYRPLDAKPTAEWTPDDTGTGPHAAAAMQAGSALDAEGHQPADQETHDRLSPVRKAVADAWQAPVTVSAGAAADAAVVEPAPTADEDAPNFLREAERAERWRRPAVRRTMAATVLLGTLLLGLQVALEYRDLVAARWTETRPALETLCHWAGCRVEHPRLLDALVVDSSGLVRVDGTSTYRFSAVLRNRSALTLAIPAIDLTLTDTQGRVISRRALSALELGIGASSVPAASELPLQATLGIAERPVAGYTIEVFYP